MRELAGRLDALDADAGSALRVVTYFDELIDKRAGLESVVRGAAILSGHPALLVDEERGVRMRITSDGVRRDAVSPANDWCYLDIEPRSTLWLELAEPAGPVEAVVLERAASAARVVLGRTRSRSKLGQRHDLELIEVVLDATASEQDRSRAAQLLGLPETGLAQVVAFVNGRIDILPRETISDPQASLPGLGDERAGVGPAVLPKDLPGTEVLALMAARFTAGGDGADPGPRVVYVERLGGLLLLAQAVDAHEGTVPDVVAVERAIEGAPWMPTTLYAISVTSSLRAAAARVQVHHSTLQGRLALAERRLGWSLKDDEGRMRLNVALTIRRLHRNGSPRRSLN